MGQNNDNSNPNKQLDSDSEDERPTHYNHHQNCDTDNRHDSLHDNNGDEEKEVESVVAIEENSDFEEQLEVEQPRTPPRPQRPLNPPPPPRRSQIPHKNHYFDDNIYGRRPVVEIEKSMKTKKISQHKTTTKSRIPSTRNEFGRL